MPVLGRDSACPYQEQDGFCDAVTGVRCSQVSACPNFPPAGGSGEWNTGLRPASPRRPSPPADDSPRPVYPDLARKEAEANAAEKSHVAERERLFNVLLRVVIVLLVVLAAYLMAFAGVTGSTAPLGGLATLMGVAISVTLWLRSRGASPGGPWGGG